jgi:hypothetical protein
MRALRTTAMLISRFCLTSFAALSVMITSSRGVASTDDLFTGTLSIEQGNAILTRCDAAANRYRLIDQRISKPRSLLAYAIPQGDVVDVIGTANDSSGVSTLAVTDITTQIPRPLCHLDEVEAMFAEAAAQPVDPNETFDIPALLECRSDIATAARFRNWLYLGPKRLAAAGLFKVTSRNFLAEYRTAAPLTVFGHKTSILALHPDGVLTVLNDVSSKALARALNAPAMLSHDPFIAQKVIETSPGADVKPGAIAVRMQTVTSRDNLPGKAVAGCLYLSTGAGNL